MDQHLNGASWNVGYPYHQLDVRYELPCMTSQGQGSPCALHELKKFDCMIFDFVLDRLPLGYATVLSHGLTRCIHEYGGRDN